MLERGSPLLEVIDLKKEKSSKNATKELQVLMEKKSSDSIKLTGLTTKSTIQLKEMLVDHPGNEDILKEIEKRRIHWKNYYNNNKDKYKQWNKKWRLKNKDKTRGYAKTQREIKKAEVMAK